MTHALPDAALDQLFRHARTYKAEPGVSGGSGNRHGRNGNDLVLKAPVGTVITAEGSGVSWDLDEPGKRVVIASGGKGGRGNARFANSIRQAPSFAEKGLPGQSRDLKLELKLLALVRRAGLPEPVLQHEMAIGQRAVRIDFAWPEIQAAVEADGHRWHATGQQVARDRARRRALRASGWTVDVFGWDDVVSRPDVVITELRRLATRFAA